MGLVRAADEQSVLAEGLVPYLKMNNISEEWATAQAAWLGCDAVQMRSLAMR